MKRIFTLLFLTYVCCLGYSQKLVLIEEFTQASCPPCETSTPELNATLTANADKVVQLRYQTSWPGVDPMNENNPGDVEARVNYYGVSGVPDLRINGGAATGVTFPTLVSATQINSEAALPTDITLSVDHTFSDDLSTVDIVVNITNAGATMYDMSNDKLRVAGVEEVIHWPFRPGSTSIQDFEYVMKSFYTGVAGVDVEAIPAGETITLTYSGALPSVVYNLKEFRVVAFVQNDDNKSVINAAESEKIDLIESGYVFTDMEAEDLSTKSNSFCDPNLSQSIKLINGGSVNITQATIEVVKNGISEAIEWTGDLAPGMSEDVDLGSGVLEPGAAQVYLSVTSVNDGASETGLLNARTEQVQYNVFGDFDTVDEGFEGKSFGDQGDFIVDANHGLAFVTVTPAELGQNVGNGSANSLLIDFWTWSSVGETADMYYGEMDLSEFDAPQLSFDRAGATYQGAADKLEILVSSDCGESWNSVFNKAGSSLINNGTLNSERFIPGANSTWDTEVLDLSDFAGAETLSILFRATTDYGNSVYIDNINISNNSVGLEEIENVEVFDLSPNPAIDQVNVDFSLDNNEEYSLTLLDFSGKMVRTIVKNSQSPTKKSVDVSNLSAGLYFIQANTAEGVKVKKFVKQ